MSDPEKSRYVLDTLKDSNLSWDAYVNLVLHDSTVKNKQKITLEGYSVLKQSIYSALLQRLLDKHPTFFEKSEIEIYAISFYWHNIPSFQSICWDRI